MSTLFDPIQIGALKMANRVVMSPITRMRAFDERSPGPLNAQHYALRASAGLIITEATSVTPQGVGYPHTPGIWTEKQVAGWKEVTSAVHAAGGLIVSQLWHVGRVSDPVFHDGEPPVAPSAVAAEGYVSRLRPQRPFTVPRALRTEEIPGIVEDFRVGAANARRAGFDGVELHAANGYLFDQFLHDGSNQRTDRYGGSIENRARFLLEALDAVALALLDVLVAVEDAVEEVALLLLEAFADVPVPPPAAEEESPPPPPPPQAASRQSRMHGRALLMAGNVIRDSSKVSSCYQNLKACHFQGGMDSM